MYESADELDLELSAAMAVAAASEWGERNRTEEILFLERERDQILSLAEREGILGYVEVSVVRGRILHL